MQPEDIQKLRSLTTFEALLDYLRDDLDWPIEDYEADDLIATYAKKITDAGAKVTVISSDKDLMQLVSDKIRLYDPMKSRVIGEKEVLEKFGVKPSQVIDVQSLAGDSSDNVPGVPGIGVKTAAELINKYENCNRSFYGGAIGFMDFEGNFNHAIIIRSFLSKNYELLFQAGAGIVSKSIPKNELQEIYNKLGALNTALEIAEKI